MAYSICPTQVACLSSATVSSAGFIPTRSLPMELQFMSTVLMSSWILISSSTLSTYGDFSSPPYDSVNLFKRAILRRRYTYTCIWTHDHLFFPDKEHCKVNQSTFLCCVYAIFITSLVLPNSLAKRYSHVETLQVNIIIYIYIHTHTHTHTYEFRNLPKCPNYGFVSS